MTRLNQRFGLLMATLVVASGLMSSMPAMAAPSRVAPVVDSVTTLDAGGDASPGPEAAAAEPTPEPTPEPAAEPTPEAAADPTPEPAAEPTPEAAADATRATDTRGRRRCDGRAEPGSHTRAHTGPNARDTGPAD